ncbi:MAG: hypothetical protein NW200_05905 [Hyphomonadaceae bacterium]|nr:hypothetical protein [Hyphomonadaceae bacterium]
MNTNTLIILELLIFNGIILAWAIREFMSVKPERPSDADAPTSSPDDARHPEG